MVNILNLVEKSNAGLSAVQFPVVKSLTFNSPAFLTVLADKLKGTGIVFLVTSRDIRVQLSDVREVNLFAELYFPVLFEDSLLAAKVKDSRVKVRLVDRVRGRSFSTNEVIVRESIASVRDRLNACNIPL